MKNYLRLSASTFLLILFIVSAHGQYGTSVFNDNFQSYTVGNALPSPWSTSGNWVVRQYGTDTVVDEEDTSGGSGRTLTRTFSAITKSWTVDTDYDWAWGGTAGVYGAYSLIIDVDMLNSSNNGYRIEVHEGNSNSNSNNGELITIFKITGGTATPLTGAQGTGYNQAGWHSNKLSQPVLKHIRFAWDQPNQRLSAYYDPGTTATSNTTGTIWSASGTDSSYSSFTQIVITARGFSNSEQPDITDVAVSTPDKFVWGVNGHPADSSSSSYWSVIPLTMQLSLAKSLGCSYYRVDFSNINTNQSTTLSSMITQAASDGLKLLPVLGTGTINIFNNTTYPSTTAGMSQLETDCYNYAQGQASAYVGQFDHVELMNEMDGDCITSGAAGSLTSDYGALPTVTGSNYDRVMLALKGLSTGYTAGDPSAKIIIDTAGWYHYGFLDRLISDGVSFDVVGWHWYSNMGSMSRVMEHLAGYGKPIWITEMDRECGSLNETTAITDNFNSDTVGSSPSVAPSAWTATGTWVVQKNSSVVSAVETDANSNANPSLSEAFTPTAGLSWTAQFDSDWEYGGTTTYGNAGYVSDLSVLDGSNNGYKVRVHQGNNNVNSNYILELFRIVNGVATSIGHSNNGLNRGGWSLRGGLTAGDIESVKLRLTSGTSDRVEVLYEPATSGSWTRVIDYTDATPPTTSFSNIVVTPSGWGAAPYPTVDNISLTTLDHGTTPQAAQSSNVQAFTQEMWNFPGVEAVFAYELLDENDQGVDNPEAYYGVCQVTGTSTTITKPAYNTFYNQAYALGTIPSFGDVIVDDSYTNPAVTIANTTTTWASTTTAGLTPFYFIDYLQAPAISGSSVTFYPFVASNGTYTLSLQYPAIATNCSATTVKVHTPSGTTTVPVNEQSNPTGWINLGNYTLQAFQPGDTLNDTNWLTSTNACWIEIDSSSAAPVAADAVRVHATP